jgi:hypothetical protein
MNNALEEKPDSKTPTGWHKFWDKEIEAARKRMRKFHRQGNKVVNRYLDERSDGNTIDGAYDGYRGNTPSRLNLFYQNVSTKEEMLFGQIPKIDVSREHQDPNDDVARVAASLIKRMLDADTKPSGEDLPTIGRSALQDRLLPGLGVARVRYTQQTIKVPSINPETGEEEEVDQLVSEDAPIDYVHWQDCLWGWGRNWKELPWWAFRSWLTKTEVTQRFGKDVAQTLQYENQLPSGEEKRGETVDTDQKNNVQKAEIWEIWQKNDRTVYWWSKGADKILDKKDDPLGLEGFWPMPRPLMANLTTTLFQPKADFVLAQDLYNEIDELQSRISTITEAVKVVGVYDQSAGDSVGRMLKEGVENDLIPVENWAMFAEKGGLAGAIDWFPVQEVVATLQTLNQVQQAKIAQLHEVTGLSDLIRGGNTDQYAGAGTQQLKAKFGSVKIQALQDQFARFMSDLEAIRAEVIAKHFEPSSIYRQANAEYMPEPDKPMIMPAIQLIRSPDVRWRINIRPESIAMVDYAQLKSERVEFVTAVSTYIQSSQAMVQAVPGSLPVLLEILKWVMSGFKGAQPLESMLDQAIDQALKTPPQQQDDGKAQAEQAKLQVEQMKHQNKMAEINAKAQSDIAVQQSKIQGEIAKIRAELESDLTLEQRQTQNALLQIMEESSANLAEISANLNADLTVERAQAAYDIESQQVEHENNIREIRANAQMATVQRNG